MSTTSPDVRAGADGTSDAAPTVAVVPAGGDAYRLAIRGHTVLVDQPTDAGGDDRGPTPTELLVAALAGCVAFDAGWTSPRSAGRDRRRYASSR